jgi:hypothetical protein
MRLGARLVAREKVLRRPEARRVGVLHRRLRHARAAEDERAVAAHRVADHAGAAVVD